MSIHPGVGLMAGMLLFGLPVCAPSDHGALGRAESWARYRAERAGYTHEVDYPGHWKVTEAPVATHFSPEGRAPTTSEVTIVVFDLAETPPPPVFVTYTTVRVIEPEGRALEVLKRDPAAANERYFVRLQQGRFTTEIRLMQGQDSLSEAVYDRMVRSYVLYPH